MTDTPTPPGEGYERLFGEKGFAAYAGPVWRRAGADGAPDAYVIDIAPHHLNAGEAVHGGLLMTLADVAMGATCHFAIDAAASSTVSLNCDFIAAGKPGAPVLAEARVTRRTRALVFLACTLTQGDRTLMTASGIWKIIGEN